MANSTAFWSMDLRLRESALRADATTSCGALACNNGLLALFTHLKKPLAMMNSRANLSKTIKFQHFFQKNPK